MQIDQRFLTINPATAVWWERRDVCESCAHFNVQLGREGERMMLCRRARTDRRQQRDIRGQYCIDARDEEGICGPTARFYQPLEPMEPTP